MHNVTMVTMTAWLEKAVDSKRGCSVIIRKISGPVDFECCVEWPSFKEGAVIRLSDTSN